MKKIIAAVLAVLMVTGLCSCSPSKMFDGITNASSVKDNVYENSELGIRITIPSGELFYTTSEIDEFVYTSSGMTDETEARAREKSRIFAYAYTFNGENSCNVSGVAYADAKSKKEFFENTDKTAGSYMEADAEPEKSNEKIGNVDFEKRVYHLKYNGIEADMIVYYGIYRNMGICISMSGDNNGVTLESLK